MPRKKVPLGEIFSIPFFELHADATKFCHQVSHALSLLVCFLLKCRAKTVHQKWPDARNPRVVRFGLQGFKGSGFNRQREPRNA